MADDRKWYPPDDRKAGSVGRRAVWVTLVVVVLAGVAVAGFMLGGGAEDSATKSTNTTGVSSTTTTETPTSSSTSSVPPAEDGLAAAAAAVGGVTAHTVLETTDGIVGVSLHDADTDTPGGEIRTWQQEGSAWKETARPDVGLNVSSWFEADVTGDGRRDLVLSVVAASGFGGVVLSGDSAALTPVEFVDPDGQTANPRDLRLEAEGLTSTHNLCEPSCAEGRNIDYVWRYDPASGTFIR